MSDFIMLRALMLSLLGVFISGVSGCAVLDNKPAADTPAATARMAYTTCDGCHGPKNVRVEFMSPKIIGQKKVYLAAKLHDFRDLKRINPYMNGVVSGMSDQDIANLAAYYSSYGQGNK
jgi:cytochrome c553